MFLLFITDQSFFVIDEGFRNWAKVPIDHAVTRGHIIVATRGLAVGAKSRDFVFGSSSSKVSSAAGRRVFAAADSANRRLRFAVMNLVTKSHAFGTVKSVDILTQGVPAHAEDYFVI